MNASEAQEYSCRSKVLKDDIRMAVERCYNAKKNIQYFGKSISIYLNGQKDSVVLEVDDEAVVSMYLFGFLNSASERELREILIENVDYYFTDACASLSPKLDNGRIVGFVIADEIESGFHVSACEDVQELYDVALRAAIRNCDISTVSFNGVWTLDDLRDDDVPRERFLDACVQFAGEIKEVIENDGWTVFSFDLKEHKNDVTFEVLFGISYNREPNRNWLFVTALQPQ